MTEAKTILVVDDDREIRAGVQAMLRQHGYHTLEAEDGLQARHLIDGQCPDLVILDMMMPHWGGFAVLEHFRGAATAPPFIMITGHAEEKHQRYARQIGVVDYIRKPFSLQRLLQGVENILHPAERTAPAAPDPADAPTVRCRCSACGARIKAPALLLGQTRPCPGCKRPLFVQPQPPEDEGPALVLDSGQPPAAPRR